MATNRVSLQRAFEISFERWARVFQVFKEVNCNKAFAAKRLTEVANRYAVGLGITLRGANTPKETTLLGPALGALAYSFTVCWGQFYVLFWVFSTWLLGSLIIFVLFRLLGSSHDLLEVTATIGYAIAPLVLLEPLMTLTEDPLPGLSLVVKIFGVAWATRCASTALVQPNTEKKIFLFACPLILFNVYLLSLRSGA